MKILIHCCCGPCATAPVQQLQEQGHSLIGLFYNPNIQPYQEYKMRRNTFVDYAEKIHLPYILDDQYALEHWLGQVAAAPLERCAYCYTCRLEKAALYAKEKGCQAYTTSLLVSPYQKHDLIRELGEKIGVQYGVDFYYQDFRTLYQTGVEMSKQMEMYRQKYCGCIYSEKERYHKKDKYLEKI